MDIMLIRLDQIVKDYNLKITGVLHIGAHYGQEYLLYRAQGIERMLFFEPVRANYMMLKKELELLVPPELIHSIKSYNVALGNEVGTREMYIETYKGQSCSLLEPGTHLQLHPQVKFTGSEIVKIIKLDLIEFDRTKFNMINIDVQGFELEVFKGSVETLKHIDIIYTEVNFEEVYKNCCRVEDLDVFLKDFGFARVLTKDSRASRTRTTWGDALYLKR